jgi:hypothetical protein
MAGRIRSIKPEILDDEEAVALSDESWRLWVSMWLLADDVGNCRAGDRYLAALVWQDSGRSPRVAAILRELRRARRVEIYDNGGERYAHIRNWEKHQRIDNAGRPRVPGPDHEDSKPWAPSRGESRRVAAVRGSDLDQDLRPPTAEVEGEEEREEESFVAASPPAAPTKGKAKEPLPFTVKAALVALKETAGMSITLAPFDEALAKPLTRLIRAFPVLEDWRLAGEWLAAGGESWLVDGPDLRWLAKGGNLASAIGKARKWAEAGKGPIDGRRGRPSKTAAPPREAVEGEGGFRSV